MFLVEDGFLTFFFFQFKEQKSWRRFPQLLAEVASLGNCPGTFLLGWKLGWAVRGLPRRNASRSQEWKTWSLCQLSFVHLKIWLCLPERFAVTLPLLTKIIPLSLEAAGPSALLALMPGSDEDSTSLSPVMGSRGKGPGLESQCLSSVLLLISCVTNQLWCRSLPGVIQVVIQLPCP